MPWCASSFEVVILRQVFLVILLNDNWHRNTKIKRNQARWY